MNMTAITELLKRPLTTASGETFYVDENDSKFKEAVAWCFHGEPDDELVESLNYSGDLEKVKVVACYLELFDVDFDDVYEWGNV